MSLTDNLDLIDASLKSDGRFKENLQRVSYEPGMLLGLKATHAEQDYHRRRLIRHHYWLHGSGTVCGLRVDLKGDTPPDDSSHSEARLHITPGIGIDGLGREVYVHEPYCIDLGAWLTLQYEDKDGLDRWNRLISDGYHPASNTLRLAVTMRYQDQPSGLQPVMATEVNAGTDPVQPSLIKDCVYFDLFAQRPEDSEFHPFASHNALPPYGGDVEGRLNETEKKTLQDLEDTADPALAEAQLAARLLYAMGDDSEGMNHRQATSLTPEKLAQTLLAHITIQLAPDQTLIVNPLRIEVNNLVRPFVMNAATLALLNRSNSVAQGDPS